MTKIEIVMVAYDSFLLRLLLLSVAEVNKNSPMNIPCPY